MATLRKRAIPEAFWGSFNACIASHVIEHIPNPIGFYHSLDRLLAPHGVVLLVVPDKRYTFDFFKPHSVTSQLIEANRQHRTRHTKSTTFDNIAMNCQVDGNIAWASGINLRDIKFFNDILSAQNVYLSGREDGRISLMLTGTDGSTRHRALPLIMVELNALWLLNPFRVPKDSYSTFGCEF